VNLQSNDFELFGLTEQFAQERSALDARWKSLQAQAHPDKFAAQGGAAQRLAMQWSVRINEAYQRLKNPLQRAAYLCELHGAPIQAHSNTAMAPAFLMQQIEWREALDASQTPIDAEDLLKEVKSSRNSLLAECEQILDVACDFHAAAAKVRALMFVERFIQAVMQRMDHLERA
jgi:molecular chaperone HscB